MWMKTKYWTFQEVLNLYPARAPRYPHDNAIASNWFTKMLEDAGLSYSAVGLSSFYTAGLITEIVNALMTIVYERHSEDYVYYKEMLYNEDYSLAQGDFEIAVKEILNVLNITLPRYAVLLYHYDDNSANPIAKLESETTGDTRFNDTPQGSDDFNDSDHSTNVSHSVSESKVDSGSIMDRLESIFKGFRSIILDWANEFNPLFLKEAQIK